MKFPTHLWLGFRFPNAVMKTHWA